MVRSRAAFCILGSIFNRLMRKNCPKHLHIDISDAVVRHDFCMSVKYPERTFYFFSTRMFYYALPYFIMSMKFKKICTFPQIEQAKSGILQPFHA